MIELLPHQLAGIARIKADGSLLLGDEPGVGKTAQMIMATKDSPKVLILTLASLKYQMAQELDKWLENPRVGIITGSPAERLGYWKSDFQYYIANYELLLRDLPAMFAIKWDYIVADECTRLSNSRNKQWKQLRKLPSRFRLAMTGTPISNSPTDIYGILEWLKPGCIGSWWNFMSTYTIRNPQGWIVGSQNLEQLARLIKPHMLRRLKSEVLDLPGVIESDILFPLGNKERKLYDTIRKGLLLELQATEVNKIDHVSNLDRMIVKFGKLCELCDSMELLGNGTDSAKLDALRAVLETLNGSKVIIFTRFSRMADIIERELHCLKIIGSLPAEARARIIEQFNSEASGVLVGTKALAYGLNLQSASVIINFDSALSLSETEQRLGRAHRYGQTAHVLVYNLISMKTVDQMIAKKLKSKQDMSRLLLSGSGQIELIKEILNDE